METEDLERYIREHPFFAGLDEGFRTLVCGCAKNVRFEAGQYLFHEGESADHLYLLRHGRVSLEVTTPGRGAISFLTLTAGDIVGISWLIPPFRWAFDAKAVELTRAVAMDATCLRQKCEDDHHLGYDLMKRIVPVLISRLHGAQMQMLDVFGRTD